MAPLIEFVNYCIKSFLTILTFLRKINIDVKISFMAEITDESGRAERQLIGVEPALADAVARGGLAGKLVPLAGASETPERQEVATGEFEVPAALKAQITAIMEGFPDGVSRRRLFYELYSPLNIGDSPRAQKRYFYASIDALVSQGVIVELSHKDKTARTKDKTVHRLHLSSASNASAAAPDRLRLHIVGENSPTTRNGENLVIPPHFRQEVEAILAANQGEIHFNDLAKLFPAEIFTPEGLSRENYRILSAAFRQLVEAGVLVHLRGKLYGSPEVAAQPVKHAPAVAPSPRVSLDQLIRNAGISAREQPAHRPRNPVGKNQKR